MTGTKRTDDHTWYLFELSRERDVELLGDRIDECVVGVLGIAGEIFGVERELVG